MWFVVFIALCLAGCGQVGEQGEDFAPDTAAPKKASALQNDVDEDGIANAVDNCVTEANPEQYDTDRDGEGNACDFDIDGDGFANEVDPCPFHSVTQDAASIAELGMCYGDYDADGLADLRDNCPGVINYDQADSDGDGYGDKCPPGISEELVSAVEEAPEPAGGFGECERVHEGPVRDVEEYRQLRESRACVLKGDFLLDSLAVEEVVLPDLQRIQGNLLIHDADGLETVQFPALHTVEGDVELSANDALYLVDLSNLRHVGADGALTLDHNPALPIVHLPQLVTVTGPLAVVNHLHLHTLILPRLQSVGALDISSNDALVDVDMSALAEVLGELYLGALAGMQEVQFPVLQSVAGSLQLRELPRLTGLRFPQLRSLGAGVVRVRDTLYPGVSLVLHALPSLELPATDDLFVESDILQYLHDHSLSPVLRSVQGGLLMQE